jgi:NTE family protein
MFGYPMRKTSEDVSGGGPARRRKLGVVLGAGAARGWAHIGALQELAALGITPDIVVGSSVGAVVGGCYAAGKLDQLEVFTRSLTKRRVFGLIDFSFNGGGLIGGDRLRQRLEESMGALNIEELPLRFASVATEIATGHEIWLKRGPLVEAMRASYALPGIFEPVRVGGRWLIDGAIVNPVPISVARAMGADQVIALNIAADGFGRGTAIQNPEHHDSVVAAANAVEAPAPRSAGVIDSLRQRTGLFRRQIANPGQGPGSPGLASVMVDAFNITQDRIMRSRLAGDPPDVMVTLRVGKIGLFEFHRAEELIALGREAVRKAAGEIMEAADLARPATVSA